MPSHKGTAAVRRYLEALETNRPKRGRKRTAESVTKRLAAIEAQIGSVGAMQRLALTQERLDLQGELATIEASSDMGKLESEFVKTAKAYSDARGISYTAWRELGVSADVLRKAGVPRTRRKSI